MPLYTVFKIQHDAPDWRFNGPKPGNPSGCNQGVYADGADYTAVSDCEVVQAMDSSILDRYRCRKQIQLQGTLIPHPRLTESVPTEEASIVANSRSTLGIGFDCREERALTVRYRHTVSGYFEV